MFYNYREGTNCGQGNNFLKVQDGERVASDTDEEMAFEPRLAK